MTFRIDILNSSGEKLASGPLRAATSLSDTRKLDEAGTVEFSMPANDPRAKYIASGTQFDIYDETDGYLGRFTFKNFTTSDSNGEGILNVEAWDALRELSHYSTHFKRTYVNEAVEDVIDDLLSIVSGWTANTDTGIGNTTVSYEGESVARAVGMLRERFGQHYRLGDGTPGAPVLDFGAFGDDSDVRLIYARDLVQSGFQNRPEIAIVETVSVLEDRDEIINRIIPLGAGQGTIQLTIEEATLGSYAVQTGTNDDGSSFYYIEDSDSVAAYGLREAIMSMPKIRPITNSDANIINAANALKLTAEVALIQKKDPRKSYAVSVRGLRKDVKPGQKIRLSYVGSVDGVSYIEIEEDFYVLDITRRRTVSGDRTTALTISSIAEPRVSDVDIIFNSLNDIQALKLHVPVSLSYSSVGPYVRRIDSANDATFTARIKGEVLALNRAIVQLRTSPLKSSVKTTQGGGGTSTSTAGGGGTSTSTAAGGSTTPTSTSNGDHGHKIASYVDDSSGGTTRKYIIGTDAGGTVYGYYDTTFGADIFTATQSGDHNHDVSVPSHTHSLTLSNHTHNFTLADHTHAQDYGIFEDSETPENVRIAIDGVDRTSALGGPWAPTGAELNLELDITTYFVNASGGLRQDHTVTVSCDTGQGDVEVGIDMLVSIQPIEVT